MLGHMAIGLAVAASGVPASFAQDSRLLEHCKSAGTGTEAEGQPTKGPGSNKGVSIEVPIGKVCVGPESLDGEPFYVRRTDVGNGITIVEVSTMPFVAFRTSNGEAPQVRPDQPAGW